MKKIVYTILSVLLILPFAVKADMSGPMIREYDMEVINPDGAQLYDYVEEGEEYVLKPTDTKLPYGTRFTVSDDYDGEEYVSVSIYDEEADESLYDGYANRKDCRSVVKDFKITEKELSEKYNIIVLEDIEIKKGPSYGYAGTGVKIKKGTKLTARKILAYDEEDKKYYEEEFDPWLYVEYNKTKGYIIAYEGTIGFDIGKVTAMTAAKVNMYNSYSDEEPFATIPANTKITTQTYQLDIWSDGYYIEYNGKKGSVYSDYYLVESEPLEYTTVKELKVYESIEEDDNEKIISKVVGTIPAGTKGSSKYWDSENWADFFRYENGNVKGWVYVPTYDDNDEDYNESDYIELDYPWDDYEEDEEEPLEDEEPEETEDPEVISSSSSDFEPYTIPRRNNKSIETLYICLIAVAVISITTIVIIVLVNKKKSKNEEPKEEIKEEPKQEEVKEETKEEVKKEKKK